MPFHTIENIVRAYWACRSDQVWRYFSSWLVTRVSSGTVDIVYEFPRLLLLLCCADRTWPISFSLRLSSSRDFLATCHAQNWSAIASASNSMNSSSTLQAASNFASHVLFQHLPKHFSSLSFLISSCVRPGFRQCLRLLRWSFQLWHRKDFAHS